MRTLVRLDALGLVWWGTGVEGVRSENQTKKMCVGCRGRWEGEEVSVGLWGWAGGAPVASGRAEGQARNGFPPAQGQAGPLALSAGLHPQLVSVPQALVALGARGRRQRGHGRCPPSRVPSPSRRPALPEPESGRARPLPAGGGRAAESRREGLWAQLAVPAVSATTPGACACVCWERFSQCQRQRPQNPAPPAACLPPARRSLPPQDPPTSVRFLTARVGLALVGMGVSAWWSGQPQVGELGYRVGWRGTACPGWRLSSEAWGTKQCGQPGSRVPSREAYRSPPSCWPPITGAPRPVAGLPCICPAGSQEALGG